MGVIVDVAALCVVVVVVVVVVGPVNSFVLSNLVYTHTMDSAETG